MDFTLFTKGEQNLFQCQYIISLFSELVGYWKLLPLDG